MPKSLLLPKEYSDQTLRITIFHVLKPYEIEGAEDAVNPLLKWDLRKAYNQSEEPIVQIRWEKNQLPGMAEEYAAVAYTEAENECLNQVIAGIVAYQLMNPDEKVALRRIEYKKGGEVMLVLSKEAAYRLQELVPEAKILKGSNVQESGLIRTLLKYLQQLLCFFKKKA